MAPRVRTIDQAAEWLQKADPDTAFTKTALRRMVVTGQLPSVRVGHKYLIDLGTLEVFLQGATRNQHKDYEDYEVLQPINIIDSGEVDFSCHCIAPVQDRSYLNIGKELHGFKPEELVVHLSDEAQNLRFYSKKRNCHFSAVLKDAYSLVEFPYNAAGFLRFTLICESDCTVRQRIVP